MTCRTLLPSLLVPLVASLLTTAPADDASDLKAVVEKFFALYAKKDLDAFMSLWSEKSPDFASRKQGMRARFGFFDETFVNLVVSRVKVEGDTATLRASLDHTETAMRTKESRKKRVVRNFRFVQENGAWKVWRYYPSAEDLAAALLTAKTEDERKALIAGEPELLPELGHAFHAIGHERDREGSYDQALQAWQEWLKLAEAADNQREVASVFLDLGHLYRSQGSYALALETLQKSLNRSESVGDKALAGLTLVVIGQTYHLHGDNAQALEAYRKGFAIHEALGDKNGMAAAMRLSAYVQLWQGNHAAALDSYQKCLQLATEAGNSHERALAMVGGAFVNAWQGNFAPAVESFQKVLSLSQFAGNREGIGLSLLGLGFVHYRQRDHVKALEYFQKALSYQDALGKDLVSMVWMAVADCHRLQGNYEQALQTYDKSLRLAESIANANAAFYSHWGIGDVHKAQGQKQEAVAAYRKAIATLETIRGHVVGGEEAQLTYLQTALALRPPDKDDVYQSLVALLVEQGNLAEALKVLERAKSKQLLDGIRLRSLTLRDARLRDLLTRTEELDQTLAAQERSRVAEISKSDPAQNQVRLANLSELVAQTRAELLKVANAIREANPDYERFITVKVTDLPIIQRQLPKDVVVVQYLPLETALTIFIVTKEATQARTVAVPRARLDELVQTFHKQMQRASRVAKIENGGPQIASLSLQSSILNPRSSTEWDWTSAPARPLRDTLTTLYGYLIAPIQSALSKAGTVIIIPSGSLYYLPFQALAHETGRAANAPLRFLAEEKSVAVLTSLGLWNQIISSEENATQRVALRIGAFGNPDGTLPAAEQEVKRVGALFEGSLVYTGAQATRAHLENLPGNITVAHIATHGQLNELDINECSLVLANNERLKLGEIYGLAGKYPAKMTVLSACETAVGRKDAGNEVAHLANGFVEAGSTTIIASLWKVSDESTATLMERFYKELKAGKTKAEAKRLAEIALLKNPKTAHPYYWAPFVLIGDWR